jgi:transposase
MAINHFLEAVAAGAKIVILPPYSPDLNPIEKMWGRDGFNLVGMC